MVLACDSALHHRTLAHLHHTISEAEIDQHAPIT